MEVNLAPNKINLLPTMQLVKVTQNKNKILTYTMVKMTTNRKQTYLFCLSSNGMVATGQIIIKSVKTWEKKQGLVKSCKGW